MQEVQLPPWSDDRKTREEVSQAMHENSIKMDPSFIAKIRKTFKAYYAERKYEYDVSVDTRALLNLSVHYTPESPLINVVLQELFPVLEGAVTSEYALTTPFVQLETGIRQLHLPFDTILHGNVIVSCVGIHEEFRMEFVQTNVQGHDAVCHCLRVYPALIKGIASCAVCISLSHDRSHCRNCGKEDNREARLLRCGRCWKELRAPVWYCDALCQKADYARHKKECGRLPVK
jgi:hypothetical protein